jgi:hypothetical protein
MIKPLRNNQTAFRCFALNTWTLLFARTRCLSIMMNVSLEEKIALFERDVNRSANNDRGMVELLLRKLGSKNVVHVCV